MEIPERLKREQEKGKEIVLRDGKMYVVIRDGNGKYMLVADENAHVRTLERAGTVKVW